MKKLLLSLVFVMFSAIIFLGWSLDTLFNNYQEQQKTDEFSAYRQIVASLATTLDTTHSPSAFVNAWQNTNQLTLNLIPLAEFPLPDELKQELNQGISLVLQSTDLITINHIMPVTQQVLALSVTPQGPQQDNLSLQMMLTAAFYLGIMLFVGIWLYPLIKRLRLLSKATQTFGAGDFAWRIPVSQTSYVADIEHEFNRMAHKIETLIQDNKLLGNAVSHDLRTPLARLRFGIEALSETTKPKTKEKYIQHLSHDIKEMENLVSVLLDYARLDQKIINVKRLPLNLNKLIEGCVHNLTSSDSSPVPIDMSGLSKTQIIVDGDENYLSMLINNLLTNAQRYAVRKVQITTLRAAKSVFMCVSDDGPGISEEHRETIFKPFTRGENLSEQVGFGMGLAIVARVSAWHDAQVAISQCDELGGAKFTVTFITQN